MPQEVTLNIASPNTVSPIRTWYRLQDQVLKTLQAELGKALRAGGTLNLETVRESVIKAHRLETVRPPRPGQQTTLEWLDSEVMPDIYTAFNTYPGATPYEIPNEESSEIELTSDAVTNRITGTPSKTEVIAKGKNFIGGAPIIGEKYTIQVHGGGKWRDQFGGKEYTLSEIKLGESSIELAFKDGPKIDSSSYGGYKLIGRVASKEEILDLFPTVLEVIKSSVDALEAGLDEMDKILTHGPQAVAGAAQLESARHKPTPITPEPTNQVKDKPTSTPTSREVRRPVQPTSGIIAESKVGLDELSNISFNSGELLPMASPGIKFVESNRDPTLRFSLGNEPVLEVGTQPYAVLKYNGSSKTASLGVVNKIEKKDDFLYSLSSGETIAGDKDLAFVPILSSSPVQSLNGNIENGEIAPGRAYVVFDNSKNVIGIKYITNIEKGSSNTFFFDDGTNAVDTDGLNFAEVFTPDQIRFPYASERNINHHRLLVELLANGKRYQLARSDFDGHCSPPDYPKLIFDKSKIENDSVQAKLYFEEKGIVKSSGLTLNLIRDLNPAEEKLLAGLDSGKQIVIPRGPAISLHLVSELKNRCSNIATLSNSKDKMSCTFFVSHDGESLFPIRDKFRQGSFKIADGPTTITPMYDPKKVYRPGFIIPESSGITVIRITPDDIRDNNREVLDRLEERKGMPCLCHYTRRDKQDDTLVATTFDGVKNDVCESLFSTNLGKRVPEVTVAYTSTCMVDFGFHGEDNEIWFYYGAKPLQLGESLTFNLEDGNDLNFLRLGMNLNHSDERQGERFKISTFDGENLYLATCGKDNGTPEICFYNKSNLQEHAYPDLTEGSFTITRVK